MKTHVILFLLTVVSGPAYSFADVVYFDNGDRLSGDIATMVDKQTDTGEYPNWQSRN